MPFVEHISNISNPSAMVANITKVWLTNFSWSWLAVVTSVGETEVKCHVSGSIDANCVIGCCTLSLLYVAVPYMTLSVL